MFAGYSRSNPLGNGALAHVQQALCY